MILDYCFGWVKIWMVGNVFKYINIGMGEVMVEDL